MIHYFTFFWFLLPQFPPLPYFIFPLPPISGLSLSPPFSSFTLSTWFSSLSPFLSLSHSALCLALSGWAAPRWLRVCVHSGACRASPPPGLTTRFCLSPLNSAAPPFPSQPRHLITLHFCLPTLDNPSCHLGANDTHPHFISLPPHLLLSLPLCWKRSTLWVLSGIFQKLFVLEKE